jgi:putative flippase GtrA
MTRLKIELSKFTLVGAINFAFTFAVFYASVSVLHIAPAPSLVAASVLGMFLTYYINSTWVFDAREKADFKRSLSKYLLAGCASVGLNAIALDYIVRKSGWDPFVVQFALMPLVVVVNFSTAKFWSLRR